jgi:hypothetical protein
MTPEHIEETATGHVCRHCGGAVDAEGFSAHGLVDDAPPSEEQQEATEPGESLQHEYVEMMREASGAAPSLVEASKDKEESSEGQTKAPADELAERRRRHYADMFGSRAS